MDMTDRIREFVWGEESYDTVTVEDGEKDDDDDYVQTHIDTFLPFNRNPPF